ncbi:MAG TPA: alpha/beta fold hydrolase [Armatimonadota bacterium]
MNAKPKRRRILVWLQYAIAGFCSVTVGGVSLIVWQALHPARFAMSANPGDDGIAFEDVSFPSRDGFTLSGWWAPANTPVGTVILCHGYPADRRDVFPVIPFLHKAGFNVLAFDFRRLGKSGGGMSTIGLREPRDLEGAVDYAAKRSDRPITAMGWSMGAAACIMAAAADKRIVAVIADSPYTSLDVQTVRRFGGGPFGRLCGGYAAWLGEIILREHLSDASPLDSARRLGGRPLFLIHSRNDRLIPMRDSERIFAAVNGPRELWITGASGHIRSYGECTVEYRKRVLRFLHSAVGKAVSR